VFAVHPQPRSPKATPSSRTTRRHLGIKDRRNRNRKPRILGCNRNRNRNLNHRILGCNRNCNRNPNHHILGCNRNPMRAVDGLSQVTRATHNMHIPRLKPINNRNGLISSCKPLSKTGSHRVTGTTRTLQPTVSYRTAGRIPLAFYRALRLSNGKPHYRLRHLV